MEPEIDVQKLAKLSRISLTQAEAENFLAGFAGHLAYVERLLEVNTANVEPAAEKLPPLED